MNNQLQFGLTESIKHDEGLRLRPYKDTRGFLTIGYGHNLDAKGITKSIADSMLYNDLIDAAEAVAKNLPWSLQLNDARQAVLINMAFNMGIDKLLEFKQTLAHIEHGEWDLAAQCMMDSKWSTQVGDGVGGKMDRAERLSVQMRSGVWQ